MLARLAVAIPGWLLSAVALGFLVGCASPHGMGAFIAASVVLGVSGACCHAALIITGQRMRRSVGAICGLATFPVTTLVLERRLFFPHDLYEATLLAYLVAAGGGIAWLLVQIERAFWTNADDAPRRQCAMPYEPASLHPYAEIGGIDYLRGADSGAGSDNESTA